MVTHLVEGHGEGGEVVLVQAPEGPRVHPPQQFGGEAGRHTSAAAATTALPHFVPCERKKAQMNNQMEKKKHIFEKTLKTMKNKTPAKHRNNFRLVFFLKNILF